MLCRLNPAESVQPAGCADVLGCSQYQPLPPVTLSWLGPTPSQSSSFTLTCYSAVLIVHTVQLFWQHQHRAELLLRWRTRRALAAAFCSWRGLADAAPAESALTQRLERVQEAAAERLRQEHQRRRLRACFCAW
jgi:hypothetical protein